MHWVDEKGTCILVKNLKQKDHEGKLGRNGRIILKEIIEK
jgi:hypothetical protein